MTNDHEQILRKAVSEYGALSQIGMLYEEMGELMTVLNQWARGRVTIGNVAEEFSDVCVMLQQLPFAIEALTSGTTDAEAFEDMAEIFFDQKMERLAMRLDVVEVEG